MRPTATEAFIDALTRYPERLDWHREYLDIQRLPEIAPEDCNTNYLWNPKMLDPDVWTL